MAVRAFGVFELDEEAGELRRQGRLVHLTGQPLKALCLLVARGGTIVTRDELRRHIWDDGRFVDFDRNLNFFIGPSSSFGLVGGAAIGQADCLDGAIAFTITTTVCTDLFPACVTQSGVGVASPGLPLTFGILVPGTLVRESSGLGIQFEIADTSSRPLPVVYRGGQVPDIMGDNIEIVAEGKLDAHGTFAANTVLAKCPSRLENASPDEHAYNSTG